MRFVFSVEESAVGWRVREGKSGVAEGLTLGKAIKRARQLGRERHERTEFAVTVELVIPEKTLLLAQYPRQIREATAAA
ncbi:hypothetical protein ACFWZ1_09565 [Frateuria sp. GZRe14]|uniref:hypothetical protein n=1 Tax=Frateuria sp. GZRe14 TaxID=3351534 RepID=UPI003EDB7479